MSFADEYVAQVMAYLPELDKRLFPEKVMELFERQAQEDIAAGNNVCPCGAKTMDRIYPTGNHWNSGWICSIHSQAMWERGILRRAVVFDMTKEPA